MIVRISHTKCAKSKQPTTSNPTYAVEIDVVETYIVEKNVNSFLCRIHSKDSAPIYITMILIEYLETLNTTPLPFDPFYTDPEYNSIRIIKLLLLSDALNNSKLYGTLSYDEKINTIQLTENSCLNETIKKAREHNIRCTWDIKAFEDLYHSICYNILSVLNIKLETGSKQLIIRVFNNEIDLNTIAALSYNELCPEKFEEVTKKIEVRSNIVYTVKYTELYFCRKCKQNKATAERVQNRSNDEGSSFHITCLNCNNRWFGS